MKINGREFTTKSGAEYVYFSDMNIVLSKNAIEAYPQRIELLSQIPGYKKIMSTMIVIVNILLKR